MKFILQQIEMMEKCYTSAFCHKLFIGYHRPLYELWEDSGIFN